MFVKTNPPQHFSALPSKSIAADATPKTKAAAQFQWNF